MGFRNKKNRVHPTGNKKRQQRKERKRRRLARLVQKINPFSCCCTGGERISKNAVCPETYLKTDQCVTDKVVTSNQMPTTSLRHGPQISPKCKRSTSSLEGSPSTANSSLGSAAIVMDSPKRVTTGAALPSSPQTRQSSIVESPPTIARLSHPAVSPAVLSCSNEDSEAEEVGSFPQYHDLIGHHQLPQSTFGSSSHHSAYATKPPTIKQTADAKSCIQTNYKPAIVDLRDEFLMTISTTTAHVTASKPSIYSRSFYNQLAKKTPASLCDSDEFLAVDPSLTVTRTESEISSDFDDSFEPRKRDSQFQEQVSEESVKELAADDVTTSEEQETCPILQSCHTEDEVEEKEVEEKEEEQEGEGNLKEPEDPFHASEEQLRSHEKVPSFPGEEDQFLPLIKTSANGLRGWLLPPGIHQYAIQPEPPYSLEEGQEIMSCAINHTIIGIAIYANKFQSGLVFKGEDCPYNVECLVRTAIRNGNTTHLMQYPHDQYLNAIEAFKAVKMVTEDDWSFEWDMEGMLAPYSELGIELPEEDQPTGLPMEIIKPQTEESSLAYHVSQLDVNASEALLYTFNSYFMVFVPTDDGRILLIDVHKHRALGGGAIVLVCYNTENHVQEMLDKYHSELFNSPFNLGQGTTFSIYKR